MSSKRALASGLSFITIVLLTCAASVASVEAQTPQERHAKLRAEVESGDYAAAVQDLQAIQASSPLIFALNNYDYLLARLAQKQGDAATAQANYQSVVARNSTLSQYALWHLSELARAGGNLTLERSHLRRLLAQAPESLLREAATTRLSQSFFESRDDASAIELLKPRANSRGGPAARAALSLLAQAYQRSGQQAPAREAFQSLVMQLPDPRMPDDFALAGARGLDQLDGGGAQAAAQLPEQEYLRRALIYSFNRDFDGARRHYAAIIEHYPQSAGLADALYQTGRTYYQEGRYEDAVSYFKRVLDQYPESQSARDALGYMASAYSRTKKTEEAVAAYQRFIARYPDAPNPERSYLNIIDTLRDAGRDREALDWVQQTRARFKGQAGAALALFSQARIHVSQGAWANALSDVEALQQETDLGGTRVPGGTTKAELAFMRAYALEQLGRTEEALAAYLSLPDGRNEYYGGRATRRLRALGRDERTRKVVEAKLEDLRASARGSMSVGQPEEARKLAQSALRLTDDQNIRQELLGISRWAYSNLRDYNSIPAPKLLTEGRQSLLTEGGRNESAQVPTHQAMADELLFLGLYDEGTQELAAAIGGNRAQSAGQPVNGPENGSIAQNSSSTAPETNETKQAASIANAPRAASLAPDMAYTLAILYKRGEHADYAVRYAEPLWKKVPSDFLLELAPREMVELLYPAPYADALLQSAPQRGVDPRFILAIARQESRFKPEAKSVAAARGLLQFIPSTAQAIAAQLGRTAASQDELYDPRTAVLYGAQYMGNLFKQFPGMPQAVAASYNGGEDNVARWVARARSNDPDRYVPEIGFTQSKDYVFKVLPNYWTYQQLYNEQLQRR